jgi:hypothetical protein
MPHSTLFVVAIRSSPLDCELPRMIEELASVVKRPSNNLCMPKIQIREYWWCNPPSIGCDDVSSAMNRA